MSENRTELMMYQTEDGQTKIDVRMENETVWLSLDQMAELFQRDKSTISRHIRNIFAEGELDREAVVAKFATTASDGKTYQVDFYNLDVIISVGYRVRSLRGTQFRIWANSVLKEYLIKGFAMNDDRLKDTGGKDYFDELLERVRDIRSSEKVFWRKVLDIYATSADYSANARESTLFFQTVQNKMLYAATGMTAAELIANRADALKPLMGMTVVKGSRPTLAEAKTAKNYLYEDELKTLNRLVCAGSFRFDELHCKQDQYLGSCRSHLLQTCHRQYCFYYGINPIRGSQQHLLPYTDLWENAFLSFTLQQQRPQLCKKRVGPACRIKPLAL